MGTGPAAPFDGLAASPIRVPTAGLFDAARTNLGNPPQIQDPPGTRWENGAQFVFDPWGGAAIEDPCAPDEALAASTFSDTLAVEAWSLRAAVECNLGVGSSVLERVVEGSRRLLEDRTRWIVERELWTGATATANGWDNPFLANASTVTQVNAGAALPVSQAYAELVQAASDASNGARLLVHVPRRALVQLTRARLASRQPGTNVIEDPMGNRIVPGAGYTGGSPAGVIDSDGGFAWLYATAEVQVRLSSVREYPESRDVGLGEIPETNTVEGWASRRALVVFDPAVHFGVQADLCETCCEHSAY